nr:hypothetical protein [Tanacetum cinerariifolium]
MSTRNQEIDKAIKDHDKAIFDIQVALNALMKQQEQSIKQQEQLLKHVTEGSFLGGSPSNDIMDPKTNRPMRIGKAFMKTHGATVGELSWTDYTRAISTRFSNAMFEDPMEEIASLQQGDELHEYNSAFDALLNKVTLSESQAISLYLKGLKPEIRGPVKMFKPGTLHEAYGLAKIQNLNNSTFETKFTTAKGGGSQLKTYTDNHRITPSLNAPKLPLLPTLNTKGGGSQLKTYTNNHRITPPINAPKIPLLPTPNSKRMGPATTKTGAKVSRRLTSKELELKRAKGECFWCTKIFVPGHKCLRNQLFIIEVEDEEEMSGEGKAVPILVDIYGVSELEIAAA